MVIKFQFLLVYLLHFMSTTAVFFFRGTVVNDTIWKLSGHQAEPYAYFDMGKYKLPLKYTANYSMQNFHKYAQDYLSILLVSEDDNYFICSIRNSAGYTEDGYKDKILVYDKKAGSGFVVKEERGVGITDDILGGPPIRFLWTTDDYYIGVVEGLDLLDDIKLNQYTPVPAFKKQLATINHDTNQLIILCHKKKRNRQL